MDRRWGFGGSCVAIRLRVADMILSRRRVAQANALTQDRRVSNGQSAIHQAREQIIFFESEVLRRLGAQRQETKNHLTEYRNPQNEPGSDKRMLLALLAVFVVLGVMQYFMPKPQTPPDKSQQQQQSQSQQAPSPVAAPASSSTPVAPKSPATALKVPVKTAASETESVLETPTYRITFTNRGASVKSWLLTEKEKFKDGTEKYKYTDDNGKPFDLVNSTVASQLGNPLSFFA